MTTKQPTFKERIRLLEAIALELQGLSLDEYEQHQLDMLNGNGLIIADEVERMKAANRRFEARNAEKRKAKTASPETAFRS